VKRGAGLRTPRYTTEGATSLPKVKERRGGRHRPRPCRTPKSEDAERGLSALRWIAPRT